MTLRQDETDVNFFDFQPEDLDSAKRVLRSELEAHRRTWDKVTWSLDYVRKNYPNDARLIEALDTARHYLEQHQ